MSLITHYSLDEVRGGSEYLFLLYAEAQATLRAKQGANPSQELLLSEALRGMALAQSIPEEKINADRDRVRAAAAKITSRAHRFGIHRSFARVPAKLLEHITEEELAERAQSRFSPMLSRLLGAQGHTGTVTVEGAHPRLAVTRWEDLPPPEDPVYDLKPFDTALRNHPQSPFFHVPYHLALDRYAFHHWVEQSRTEERVQATLVEQLERECLF